MRDCGVLFLFYITKSVGLLAAPDQDYICHQIAHNIQILKRQQHRLYGHNNPQTFQ
jgi:hypothetical protein